MSAHPAIAGGCDCHMHVYEDGYPISPRATFAPPRAPAAAYDSVQRALGLSRVVVVQPTAYGLDNRCTEAALSKLPGDARGVAVIAPDIDEHELARLDRAGFRGARFMMLPGGHVPWTDLAPMAARIAPLGWNIDLQLDGCDLPMHEAFLAGLPATLVIDHVGKFLEPVRTDSEAFAALRRLLDRGRCWVKISAPYESSRSGPPGYDDVAALARSLAHHYPERCLWASNWPHPGRHPAPSDEALFDWALDCIGDAATRQRILVDNPARVYGF